MDKLAYYNGYISKFAKREEPSTNKTKLRDVLLIHGWNSGPKAFRKLKRKFEKEGRIVKAIDYSKDRMRAQKLVKNKIRPFLMANKNADIVTHSAGGLLTRMAAQGKYGDLLKNRRVLMVAPPMKGSYLANLNRVLRKSGRGGLSDRPLLKDLEVGNPLFKSMKPVKNSNIAIMAGKDGTKNKSLLGMYLNFIHADRINGDLGERKNKLLSEIYGQTGDGVVRLEHTKIPEEKKRTVMPLGHSALIKNKDGINKILKYMRSGNF